MKEYKSSILRGLSSDGILFILTILIGFATIPIYLNFITLDELGIYFTMQGIIAVISLADIGLPMYSLKKLSNKNFFNSDELMLYLSSAQIFQYILGCILLILGLIVYYYLNSIIKVNFEYLQSAKNLFLYSWFSIVITVLFGLNASILRSRHELSLVNISIFLILFFSTLLNMVWLYLGHGIEMFGISLLVSTTIVEIYFIYSVYSKHGINILMPTVYQSKYIKDGWDYIKKFQLIRISQASKTSLFTVLLSSYAGHSIVAQYNITNKIPQMIPAFISKIIINIFPSLSELFETNNKDIIRVYYKSIFKIGILITIFSFSAIYSLNELFITLWVGHDKFIGGGVFLFILINFIILILISFSGIIINSSGEFKHTPMISILELFILLFLSNVLFNIYGLIGLFMGYSLSMMVGLIYSYYIINIILNVNLLKWIKEVMQTCFIYILIAIFINLIINNLDMSNIIKFIVLFFMYIGIFGITYYLEFRKLWGVFNERN